MKIFKACMLAIGIAMILCSLYVAYTNYNEQRTFETADAVILEFVTSGYHMHDEGSGQMAVVGFAYKGDSITKNTGYYSASMEIGKHYTVVFPPGKPSEAEVQESLWTFPLFLFAFGAIFFIGPVGLLRLDAKRKERQRTTVAKPEADENAPDTYGQKFSGRLAFFLLAVGFSGGAFYLFKQRLTNPDSDVDWMLVLIITLVAFILDAIVLATWVGLFLERSMLEVDAEFVRVIPEDKRNVRSHRWRIEASWQDANTGEKYTFTSLPVKGKLLYYNRTRILAKYHRWSPSKINSIDTSFVSKKNKHGILLVDDDVIERLSAAAQQSIDQSKTA